jgi:hypothetical protein
VPVLVQSIAGQFPKSDTFFGRFYQAIADIQTLIVFFGEIAGAVRRFISSKKAYKTGFFCT